MLTGFSRGLGMQQGAEKALAGVAAGMRELEGGHHAQAFGTQRHPIAVPSALGVAVQIEGNGGDASAMHTGLIDVPGVESRIRGDVEREEAQMGYGLDVEGEK